MGTEPVLDAHSELLRTSTTALLPRQASRPTTTRSSELLEILQRLQPGADAEQHGAHDLRPDLVDVANALASLEMEIEGIVESVRQEADTIHQQAVADVQRIDDEVVLRAAGRSHRPPEAEQRTIMQGATAAAERGRRAANAEISEIVAAATALVWDTVTSATVLRVA